MSPSPFKGEDPINKSLTLRKSEPGEQVTAVVPIKDRIVNEPVFKLILKGDLPKLREIPLVNPALGQRKDGKVE